MRVIKLRVAILCKDREAGMRFLLEQDYIKPEKNAEGYRWYEEGGVEYYIVPDGVERGRIVYDQAIRVGAAWDWPCMLDLSDQVPKDFLFQMAK